MSKIIMDSSNPHMQFALWLAKSTNESFFLTGKAGTGKSTFIKNLLETSGKKVIVTAPTGIAALNVGGVTIHSLFRLPFGPLVPHDGRISLNNLRVDVLRDADTIIIDEVSMVRADVMDAIDWVLRQITGNLNSRFGGKQMIFCGDIFQLPPVVRNQDKDILLKYYEPGFYFFYSRALFGYDLPKIELLEVYRQTDIKFIKFLDKLRNNAVTDVEIQDFNLATSPSNEDSAMQWRVILTTTNKAADDINQQKLQQLKGAQRTYSAEISGDFPQEIQPTNSELVLKIGALVVLLRNDPDSRWVNGTTGYIQEMGKGYVTIRLKDQTVHTITPCVWENEAYAFNNARRTVEKFSKGSFTQLPLKLAWAMTIHKSQGLTFDDLEVDLGSNSFACGQTYVALSRVTSQKGLRLTRPLKRQDIIVDTQLISFTQSFNSPEMIQKIIQGRDTKSIDIFLIQLLNP